MRHRVRFPGSARAPTPAACPSRQAPACARYKVSRDTVIHGLRQIRYSTFCRGSPAQAATRPVSALELVAQLPGVRCAVENAAEQTIQREIVARRQRMRDDDGGDKAASASTAGFSFSSMLTMTCVGASSRMRARFTSLVPPTFGMRRTAARGWMQKPVRPTSAPARPRSHTSSVMLGTSDTMRGGAVTATWRVPAASMSSCRG